MFVPNLKKFSQCVTEMSYSRQWDGYEIVLSLAWRHKKATTIILLLSGSFLLFSAFRRVCDVKRDIAEKNREANPSSANGKGVNDLFVAGLPVLKKTCIYMIILV